MLKVLKIWISNTKMKKIILLSVIICLLSSFLAISAPAAERELITDWYLKEFHSDITVNPDSTLDIVEKIIADWQFTRSTWHFSNIANGNVFIQWQKNKNPC